MPERHPPERHASEPHRMDELEEELRTAVRKLDDLARRAREAGMELTVELAGEDRVFQSVAWDRVKGIVLYDFSV